MARHYRTPLEWDFEGAWDGVVVYDHRAHAFVRYLDRNGEHREHVVAPKAWTFADLAILRYRDRHAV
jgi:hypothetical protein